MVNYVIIACLAVHVVDALRPLSLPRRPMAISSRHPTRTHGARAGGMVPTMAVLEAGEASANDPWRVVPVDHVTDWSEDETTYVNPLAGTVMTEMNDQYFVDEDEVVIKSVVVNAKRDKAAPPTCYMHAGPRKQIYYEPSEVKAAIVTCGGICPGINTVVRELVFCLKDQYNAAEVYGVPGGYRGFAEAEEYRPLTPADVDQIHRLGGTILGTSRGGHDTNAIVDRLEAKGINQVYIIGGDGTMRGASLIAEEARRRQLRMSVVGIPKTVDNDIPIIDKSFGFETAVEAAQDAINSAVTETQSFPRGVGIVQLMGRLSGFIAMHATLGSRDVDCVLIPEVAFEFEGEGGLLEFLAKKLEENDKVILVVAEGSGQAGAGGADDERDESGNKLLKDIGVLVKEKVANYFNADAAKEHGPRRGPVNIKYIDPTYMVRSVASNAADNIYCTTLAHSAVHGAFAGLSNFCVGPINSRHTYIPLSLVAQRTNVVDVTSSMWGDVLFSTGQPSFAGLGANDDVDVCDVYSDTTYGGCTVDIGR